MSAFLAAAPAFDAFLNRFKDTTVFATASGGAPANARFLFRNFLLEERLDPARVTTYAGQLAAAGFHNPCS